MTTWQILFQNSYVVMVTGHRPKSLGGFTVPNPTEQWVRDTLRSLLVKLTSRRPNLVGISGMALGADQVFSEVCIELGIPWVAAVPFREHGQQWPRAAQKHYRQLMAHPTCKAVVIVNEEIHYQVEGSVRAVMHRRNDWMIDHSQLVLAVWDGSGGGTAHTWRGAQARQVPRIWVNPAEGSVQASPSPL